MPFSPSRPVGRCCPRLWAALLILVCGVPADAAPPIIEAIVRPVAMPFARHGREPETCVDPAVEKLAANVDWLEHNVDRWGSIVPKSPDVWGEARLTKYRREVEEILEGERKKFKQTLAGASSTRDLALLTASISAANDPGMIENGPGDALKIDMTLDPIPGAEEAAKNPATFGLTGPNELFFADELELEPTLRLDQHRRYLDHLNELRRINEGDDAADAPGYAINLVRMPVSVLPGTKTTHGYGAEITATATMHLDDDLLPRTFRDLVVNDLVDQLALPMTRFLNSDPTRVARLLAMVATLNDPDQFIADFNDLQRIHRHLIVGDPIFAAVQRRLMSQGLHHEMHLFALDQDNRRLTIVRPITHADLHQLAKDLEIYNAHVAPLLIAVERLATATPDERSDQYPAACEGTADADATSCDSIAAAVGVVNQYGLEFVPADGRVVASEVLKGWAKDTLDRDLDNPEGVIDADPRGETGYSLPMEALIGAGTGGPTTGVARSLPVTARLPQFQQNLLSLTGAISQDLRSLLSLTSLPASATRRSTLPFAPGDLLAVYGSAPLGRLAVAAHDAFRVDAVNRQIVHLTDVRAHLREEISAAYDLMCRPEYAGRLSAEAFEPLISPLVRGHRHAELAGVREAFLSSLPPSVRDGSAGVLAWAVLVDSALLNDRLHEEVARSPHSPADCVADTPLDYLGCNPSPAARDAFASYVAGRWPLRIFTIDPVDTDQNIADTASVVRQMQFAAAFAVAQGSMRSGAAMNFARNLQRDFATVAVNRTATGFVHGDDTFGWRFRPRFQTPPVQNNAVVIFRDLIGGGPTDNAIRRQRRIEPGMRECIAVILTPSFVTGMTIDTRANWFRLNKPGKSAISMRETTRQSRAVVAMRRGAEACVRRPDLYRDGEVARMLRRVDQLERELPLQTLRCDLPGSNTLGGFELLSSGTRELAPELLGWYGSPGYQIGGGPQTFFIVGDNFSVHETEAIAGTVKVDASLLSRQVMRVTVPAGVPVITDARLADGLPPAEYAGYVDVHLATPYGVSNHLLVPALKPAASARPATAAASPRPSGTAAVPSVRVPVQIDKTGVWTVNPPLLVDGPELMRVDVPGGGAVLAGSEVTLTVRPRHGGLPLPMMEWDQPHPTETGFAVGLPNLASEVGSSGELTKSLGAYVVWHLNTLVERGDDALARLGQPLPVDLAATLAVGGGPDVPIAGTTRITVTPIQTR